ncbi:uncharacterized protein LOC126984274 isoform X3 [Eriocheir sinensis]|uniref:uncharacterized protein LOC126984274 isoform X3 n=1 Tax=Eriocheir sinensis TaxID=95602 RepID=UPI0021C59891|nr:uncharacterized protein LOC126984274 isoform X3 [Eriocheir sinensis]
MASEILALILVVVGQVASQGYDTHAPYVPQIVVPVTVTDTVTTTQTVRVPVTSDVWVSTVTQYTVTATQLTTHWGFNPTRPDTVTSVITITNTPVSIIRHTAGVNPVRSVTSIFTSFVTETERKDLFHSITHIDIHHEIETVPVSSVQTLYQRITSTTLYLTTVTLTSTTRGYGH